MNWKKIIGIIAGIAMVAIVVIKLKSNKETAVQKVYNYDKEQAINVQTDTIKLGNMDAEIFYSGTFEPNKETKISAEIQGKINTVMVDLGDQVYKGQALIQLDNSLLKLQLQTIEVQLEGLVADVNRYTILAKSDAIQGIQLEKAALGLKAAKVQKATLLEQINKTTIKAPFNGIITAKLSEEGAFAAPGIPLLQISDIASLKFTVNIPEQELSLFQLNQNYQILTDAYHQISLTGKSIMIGSKANIGSSFPVQFTVKNTADLKIKSGMFGKISSNILGIKNIINDQAIVIPSSAIVGTANQAQVYLVKNGKAVLQNIIVLKKMNNKSVVKSGLKVGDVMVTNGFINLFEGANVTITN
ncbi:MAG: efflux RND transporter periplasmic adaptor subunit [Bacteroidia bacterium]